jgi:hypothetical protein
MSKGKAILLSICVFAGIVLPFSSVAQNGDDQMGGGSTAPANEVFYKYAIQGGVQIENTLANPAMVKTFTGIFGVNFSYDVAVLKRLFIGAEVHEDELAISADPLYETINPKMFNYMGGLRIGYHSAFSKDNDFLFCSTFTAGVDKIHFIDVPYYAPPQPKGFYQQSNMGILNIAEYYRINEQFWAGLCVSLTYLQYQFDYRVLRSFLPMHKALLCI